MGRSIPEAQDQGPSTPFTAFKSKPGEYTSESSSYKERGNTEDWSS